MVAATALAEIAPPPAAGAALDIEQVSHAFDIDGAELPVLSDVSISVEPGEFVAKLDGLMGTDVFVRRFREFRARRDFPDLAAVYAGLGIRSGDGALQFDDAAPAADVRRAIMANAKGN